MKNYPWDLNALRNYSTKIYWKAVFFQIEFDYQVWKLGTKFHVYVDKKERKWDINSISKNI